ncbi:MAG: hypothetical protein M3Q19_07280 [Pseudomonadota bacterium]|nr:hypothetical protein [Pseudomonadota bacterium]
MDPEEFGGLESPNWANNEELKALNQKMDWMLAKLDIMIGHLATSANASAAFAALKRSPYDKG